MIKKNILLVEDEIIIAMAEMAVLKKNNFEVLHVDSGEEAIQLIRDDSTINLILMDFNLWDGISGAEAAEEILKIKNIPIIFLTSHFEKEIVERVRNVNRYGYIIKNSGETFLISSIEMALSLFEAQLSTQESEKRFRSMADSAPVLIWVSDEDKLFTYFNKQWLMFRGRTMEEELGMGWLVGVHPDDYETFLNMYTDAFHQRKSFEMEYRLLRHDGVYRWVLDRGIPRLAENDHFAGYIGSVVDITDMKEQEDNLRQAAAVFDNTTEGLLITDVNTIIKAVNPSFTTVTGYTMEDLKDKTPRILNSGKQDKAFYEEMWQSLVKEGKWRGEIWNRRKNGEIYPELLGISAVKDNNGNTLSYVAVFSDITKIKAAQDDLDYLAHHDWLTNLPNRLMFQSRLRHAMSRLDSGKRLAILLIDLDRFKDVNDSYGHPLGDEVLQLSAIRMFQRLSERDTLARLGGDEFIVLIEDLEALEKAGRIAQELLDSIADPFYLTNGVEIFLGASIGISIYPDQGQSVDELFQHADVALYQAKKEGKGIFRYYNSSITSSIRTRLSIETRLRKAVDREELRVYFQPQVDIRTGKVVGAEALVRWKDPVEGFISPADFIPIAEESGIISQVGEWVLHQVCDLGNKWFQSGIKPIPLAVNLSPRQFIHGNIVSVVERILKETKFPAEYLEFEITESALMDREEEAIKILNQFRSMKIKLAIDDFGTGYSSLAHLKRFPLDTLKIDKSFVDEIPQNQDDSEIAATIIAMGHTLRLKVLAEGVETKEQLDFLKSCGCDLYQGFYKSKPLPETEFIQFLASNN
ncbi:MAG: EAL domain-containing protein [Leptospiraceae bacterium]|nr:EAL domain-containing protein [Leptospiraceae bacterium]